MKKQSQTVQIHDYMVVHGSITSQEAYVLCGCMRLAARAFENHWPGTLEYHARGKYSRYRL